VLSKARKGEKLGEGYTRAATDTKEKHNPQGACSAAPPAAARHC
jgi:hypothetical protein